MSTPSKNAPSSKQTTSSIVVSEEDKKRVLDYIFDSEISKNEQKIYALQHAKTAKSGYSLGKTQIDLASNGTIRGELIEFLKKQGLNTHEIATLEERLKIKGDDAAISDNLQKKVASAIGNAAGKAKIDAWDKKQADETAVKAAEVVAAARTNPRYDTDPTFRTFADSSAFFYLVADNINQYGVPDGLKNFVAGKDVSRRSGTISRLGERPLTMDTLAEYEGDYKWVRQGDEAQAPDKGAQDIRRRRLGVVNNLLADGLISTETSDSLKRTITAAYLSDNERKNGSTPAGGILIQQGDSLSKIAARHGVSAADLAKANNIADPSRIRAGQSLVLPGQASQAAPPKEEAAPKPDVTPSPKADLSPTLPFPFFGSGRPRKPTLLTAEHPDEVFDNGPLNEAEREERRLWKLYPTMAPRWFRAT